MRVQGAGCWVSTVRVQGAGCRVRGGLIFKADRLYRGPEVPARRACAALHVVQVPVFGARLHVSAHGFRFRVMIKGTGFGVLGSMIQGTATCFRLSALGLRF